MLLQRVVETWHELRATRSRTAKTRLLADLLAALDGEEIPVVVGFLTGEPRQGRIGIGWATVAAASAKPAAEPSLTVLDVDATLSHLGSLSGPGSQNAREDGLAGILGQATEREQGFLRALLVQELRQGALEGVMLEAIAETASVDADLVRRAAMLSGDVAAAARAALAGGEEALAAFRLEVGRPLEPMLAQTADDVHAALDRTGEAAVEWKLDGMRIQVHKSADDVRVWTRTLRDVTADLPAVVEAVAAIDAGHLVLDGEALALDVAGRPLTFQDSMSSGGDGGLRPFFFDLLHHEGEDMIDRPLRQRLEVLEGAVPADLHVRRRLTDDPEVAGETLENALEAGHEGVVIKALGSAYEAGRRGAAWLKVKPVHTLDLVILAAEWGSGRRRGWLSNLHLGARDEHAGGFVMLGKTFKGLTDAMLEWQTARLQELETRREGPVVHVRPELVAEIAFDGVQRSPRYPAGMALRFARVVRHRPDKPPTQADTLATVRDIFEGRRRAH